MMKKTFLCWLVLYALTGCIKDDILLDDVSPELRFITCLDSLKKDSLYQIDVRYFNYVGQLEEVDFNWSSSNNPVLTVDGDGIIYSHDYGMAYITVSYNELKDSIKVHVGNSTYSPPKIKSGVIQTTSSYQLEGDFELRQEGTDLVLDIAANYKASSSLPGLYIYLTNNNTTTSGAYEIGAVQVFEGAHSYTIPNTHINDYSYVLYFCKPFNVKVGDAKIN